MRTVRGRTPPPGGKDIDRAKLEIAGALADLVHDPARRSALAGGVILKSLLKLMPAIGGIDSFRRSRDAKLKTLAALQLVSDFVTQRAEPYVSEGLLIQDGEFQSIDAALAILRGRLEREIALDNEAIEGLGEHRRQTRKRDRDPLHQRLDELIEQWSELGGPVSIGSAPLRQFLLNGTKPLWGAGGLPKRTLSDAISRFNRRHGIRLGRGNPAFRRSRSRPA